MLKSGLCYAQLGELSYARRVLEDVEALFPELEAATVARSKREELGAPEEM